MMVVAWRDGVVAEWLTKGGETTLVSYGGDAGLVPPAHVAWLDARPLLHIDTHRVYVHAGLDPDVHADEQLEKVLLWKRYDKDDSRGFFGRHIVHGHDNIADGPLMLGGRTNLDTRAWETGRLVIGIFDDHAPGGPVDTITVRGPAL